MTNSTYTHNFDPGIFVCVEDNGNGTALFTRIDCDPQKPPLRKEQARLYSWEEMNQCNRG